MINNKEKAYAFTGGAALITAALLALTVLFTACPQSSGEAFMINITVKGDGTQVNLPAEPISVIQTSKWVNVRTAVENQVSFKPGFRLNSWHLGEDESAPELTDEDAFYTDTTVFVKSRADLPPLGPIQDGTK